MSVKHICFNGLPAALLLVLAMSGCGTTETTVSDGLEEESEFLDGLLDGIDLTEKPLPDRTVSVRQTESPIDVPGDSTAAESSPLALHVNRGDRFPLVKTVKQTLVQKSANNPAAAASSLQLHMVIQVDDVRADAVQLSVHYTRVVYDHDIGGQSVRFDSQNQLPVPVALLPYAGMIDNSFSFWLGRDNTVREVIDYEQFLQRCVQRVPDGQRRQMLNTISARLGADSVAQLVDDTIGLLPFRNDVSPEKATTVQIGDVWTRERSFSDPVPMKLTSTCRLLSMNDHTAEVDITGRITPQNASPDVTGQSPGIRVTQGRCIGSCIIDRETGLPLKLNRSQYITMAVTTRDGETVQQQKRIQTTIEAMFGSGNKVVHGQAKGKVNLGRIQRVSAQLEGEISRRRFGAPATTTPALSSTVRAVYPD